MSEPSTEPSTAEPSAAEPSAPPQPSEPSATEPSDVPLTDHAYDGIREYDNPLPFWWSTVFVLCIGFAAGYWYWYHAGGPGLTIHQEFAEKWKSYTAWRAAEDQKRAIEISEDSLRTMAHDPAVVESGHQVFLRNCVGCHTENGRGNVGANLTDDFQIHGATRMDMFATVRDGVPIKGMVSWGPILAEKDVAAVVAYVSTLRGSNVPGGKAAEGAKVGKFAD